MAFVFGEEKKAKPRPSRIRAVKMKTMGVSLPRKAKMVSPRAVDSMPPDASSPGSILSESFPV